MTMEIVIPQVGEAVAEIRLVEWLKQEGDQVHKGDPLFEIDTDKAVVVVEAFADGTLAKILQPVGSAVLPRQVVGLLAPLGEAELGPETTDARDVTQPGAGLSPAARRAAAELNLDPEGIPGTGPGGRVSEQDVRRFVEEISREDIQETPIPQRALASPLARRVARELHVDLGSVTGTGVDGLITEKDVQAFHRNRSPMAVRPLPKQRQAIAARMASSKRTAPHFYLMSDVDMSQARQLRHYCRDQLGWEQPPTYTDIVVRACALAVAALPEVNVFSSGDGLTQLETVNIGVAVGTDTSDRGEAALLVPVLPQADKLSLRDTAQLVSSLVARARQGRLRDSDLGPKSMVVSNLGMHGVDAFIAIIDPPDPMILAVGQIADRVLAIDGAPCIRPVCTLCLSADHRVMDGIVGARFLNQVKTRLENSLELLGQTQSP